MIFKGGRNREKETGGWELEGRGLDGVWSSPFFLLSVTSFLCHTKASWGAGCTLSSFLSLVDVEALKAQNASLNSDLP